MALPSRLRNHDGLDELREALDALVDLSVEKENDPRWNRIEQLQKEAFDSGDTMVCYLNVYIVEREFGGPEEGGWWYDVGTPEGVSIKFTEPYTHEVYTMWRVLEALYPDRKTRYSMHVTNEDFIIKLEAHEPREWPATRPHYE